MTLNNMYVTTKEVAAIARSKLAPRLFFSLRTMPGNPDRGPGTRGFVWGERSSSEENIIISKTKILVTLFDSDS